MWEYLAPFRWSALQFLLHEEIFYWVTMHAAQYPMQLKRLEGLISMYSRQSHFLPSLILKFNHTTIYTALPSRPATNSINVSRCPVSLSLTPGNLTKGAHTPVTYPRKLFYVLVLGQHRQKWFFYRGTRLLSMLSRPSCRKPTRTTS